MFRVSVSVRIGDGASARFWTDSWLPTRPISTTAPHLFSAVPARRHRCTVRDTLEDNLWTRDVTEAPTAAVLSEYMEV